MKVKELKEFLNEFDDDLEVRTFEQITHMSGAWRETVKEHFKIQQFSKKKKCLLIRAED